MVKLIEYLERIGDTDSRNERLTILGEMFLETHLEAKEEDRKTMYKRIVRLLKDNYDDYYELAKTIHETMYLRGNRSHWNYITVVMKNKRRGNHRE
jgi:hypothetical protein